MEARLLHGLQQGHTRGNALPNLRGAAVQTGRYQHMLERERDDVIQTLWIQLNFRSRKFVTLS